MFSFQLFPVVKQKFQVLFFLIQQNIVVRIDKPVDAMDRLFVVFQKDLGIFIISINKGASFLGRAVAV